MLISKTFQLLMVEPDRGDELADWTFHVEIEVDDVCHGITCELESYSINGGKPDRCFGSGDAIRDLAKALVAKWWERNREWIIEDDPFIQDELSRPYGGTTESVYLLKDYHRRVL